MSAITAQATLQQLQNNTSAVNFQNQQKNVGTGTLDQNGFMQLLLAQLQYQDPTQPQDNSQMLDQQVQMQEATDMTSMLTATQFSTATNMIGKQATLVDAPWDASTDSASAPVWNSKTNSAQTITGTITGVQYDQQSGKSLVQINGQYFDASTIQTLNDPALTPAPSTNPPAANSGATNSGTSNG